MALFTLSVSGPAVGNYAKEYEVADADAGRILRAFAAKFGLTEPQAVVNAIALEFLNHVLRETETYDRKQAAAAAEAAVTEIRVSEPKAAQAGK